MDRFSARDAHNQELCVLYSTYMNVHATIQGRRWEATAIWQVGNRGFVSRDMYLRHVLLDYNVNPPHKLRSRPEGDVHAPQRQDSGVSLPMCLGARHEADSGVVTLQVVFVKEK